MIAFFENIIDFFKDRNKCFNDLKDMQVSNQLLVSKYEDLDKQFDSISEQIVAMTEQLKPNPLETYWNDKRDKSNFYNRKVRTIMAGTKMVLVDPRIFFNLEENVIPSLTSGTNDEKAYNALNLVIKLIDYTADISQFKQDEEWLFAYETLALGKGDCEDGAILLANILLKSGIPYWRIRLNAGDVEGGGHCWCTYLRESDNKWVILDWCYWPEESVKGLLYHDAEKYFDIWFSFNTKHIYLSENFERD